MTWESFVKEINKWLSFKRKAADNVSELPDLEDVCKRIEDRLTSQLETIATATGKNKLNELAKEYGLDVKEADFRTVTLLDVAAVVDQAAADNSTGAVITIGTWVEEEISPLCQLAVRIKSIDGHSVPASVSIIDPQESDDVWQIVIAAVKLQEEQHARGHDVILRWAMSPYSFREKHLICPKCASSTVRDMKDAYGEESWVGCDACDWVGNKKRIEAVYDLRARERFLGEVEQAEKERKISKELEETVAAIKALTDKLDGMLTRYRKTGLVNHDVGRDVQAIIGQLEKANAVIEGRQQRKMG